MNKITFFTVCDSNTEDYEFVLGSYEHHSRVGNRYIFDVGRGREKFKLDNFKEPPAGWEFGKFGKLILPGHVRGLQTGSPEWYGSGNWKTFRLATALDVAIAGALREFPDTEFLVQLDSDEYYDVDRLSDLLVRKPGKPKTFTFPTIHWRGGKALRFGKSEYHMRAWDTRADVRVLVNSAWAASPHFNGNPEHHPLLRPTEECESVVVEDPVHFHLHYEMGLKQFDLETAKTTIDGWPDGTPVDRPCLIPRLLQLWQRKGMLPSARF